MAVTWEIDPTSEDATNTALTLTGTVTNVEYRLVEMDLTPPDLDPIYSISADTEGDPFVGARFRNRTISLGFIAQGTTNTTLQTGIQSIQQKLDKLRREGGTLKMTTPAGTTCVGDVEFARFKPQFDKGEYGALRILRYTLEFECAPFFRGTAVQLADHAETALPVCIGVDTAVGGDVPALVRILVDEDQAANQWWVVWGVQSRYYDSATSAALFYEAEGRTALTGAALAVQSGASGAGSNTVEATLDTEWLAFVSTQATAAGAHLSHIGNFRVFCRVLTPTANTGAVSVALQWGEGDLLNPTTNPQVDMPIDGWDNTFRLLDLGQVHLSKVAAGTQRWEGRFLAKSTVNGDKIRFDHFFLVPVDEGSGEVSGVVRPQVPAAFTGRDSFTGTTAGNALNTRVAPIGGTWATSGDATDYLFTDDVLTPGTHTEPLKRTVAAVGSAGRLAILGAATPTNVQVQVAIRTEGFSATLGLQTDTGVIARYVDGSNYLRGVFTRYSDSTAAIRQLSIYQAVAGVTTNLGYLYDITSLTGSTSGLWWIIKLNVTDAGIATLSLWNDAGTAKVAEVSGYSAALATGGALASGKSGLYDFQNTALSNTRYYDEFSVFVPSTDAAIFASQSLELRSDRVVREDSGGTLWQKPSRYEGDYPKFPPAGKEARSVRTIVKACRNDPVSGADTAIDDLSYRATVTPRYLVLPT